MRELLRRREFNLLILILLLMLAVSLRAPTFPRPGNLYDIAVLVSGDSDFAYALQAVKNTGKHVEVAYFESNVSKDLLDVADVRHHLDKEWFKGLWISARPPRRRRAPSGAAKGGRKKVEQ